MKILYLILLLIFCSCTSLKVQLPGNRFLSPESQGNTLSGDISIAGSGGQELEIAQDITSSSPTTNPNISEDSKSLAQAEVAIVNRLDVYHTSIFSGPSASGLKWQILGPNIRAASKKDWSLSLLAGIHHQDTRETKTLNSDTASTRVDFSGHELGLLVGYRLSDVSLIYTGYFKNTIGMDYYVDRTSGGTTTRTLDGEGEAKVNTLVLGLASGKRLRFKIERAYTKSDFEQERPSQAKAEEEEEWV